MNNDEDAGLRSTLKHLDEAFSSGDNPPPEMDQLIDRVAAQPTGVDAQALARLRHGILDRVSPHMTVGELLKKRRTALGLEVDDIAKRARWRSAFIEELENDAADLQRVDARALGNLLFVLGLSALGLLEKPLRRLASDHFAVYSSGAGPLFGRSRKGVSTFSRRAAMLKGVGELDQAATERAVEMYVIEINERLRVLTSRKKPI